MSARGATGRRSEAATAGVLGHLLEAHGRTLEDLEGLPLAEVHRFEHLEHDLGLIELDHRHDGDGAAAGG